MSAAARVTGVAGDQFYVTHCAPADSVSDRPGYTVRAASTAAPDALEAALRYPAYELPIAMWKDLVSAARAPRRLARTAHPHGGVWVAHSAYLERDTVGRDRSYFTHLLHLPASVEPAAVLKSWDAPGWAKAYPAGGTKSLPRAGLPAGRAISKGLLLGFLSRPKAGAADLSAVVCPARFHADVGVRRELVARFLHALVLVTAAKEVGRPRDRLFVHAEPGLVAMLLYAAARVLPPHFTAGLTFSTFEPAHRDIRAYNQATVVGTFLGAPGVGLDRDLATERGYALDALEPERSSPELSGWVEPPAGIAELIGLAAEGQWARLAGVHARVGSEADALTRVAKTIADLRAAPKAQAEGPKPAAPTPGSTRAQEVLPAARPARSGTRSGLWAATRGWLAASAGVLLIVLATVVAVRSVNRSPATNASESPTAAPVAPAPPAAPPVTAPKPAAAPDPMKPPVPPPGEPPPGAENAGALTETVGLVAGLQLYQTYLNIGLLADARAEGLYEAAEVSQLLGSVIGPLDKVEKQLEKVAALKSLTPDDAATVARMRKIADLLREQGKSLRSFWDTGTAEGGKKYEEARQAAWKELSELLDLERENDAPEPRPAEKP